MARVNVSLSEHMFYAAAVQARLEERHSGSSNGIASLIRKSLRAYLSKNHWETKFLDGLEPLPKEAPEKLTVAFPRTRNSA